MRMRGAIFDMDGTILDSMFIWATIGETYLRSIGYEPRENLNEAFKNMSLLQAARCCQREYAADRGHHSPSLNKNNAEEKRQ